MKRFSQFVGGDSEALPPSTQRRRSTALILLSVVAVMVLPDCRPQGEPPGQPAGLVFQSSDCDDNLEPQSLAAYADECFKAIGEDVPGFNCDKDSTDVPENHLTGPGYPSDFCDAPNVLNHECDKGSRFHVLKQTPDVEIVAHCRKKGHRDGTFGDIAVIQYNQKNGNTCFYQALGPALPAEMPSPSATGGGVAVWQDPMTTAGQNCIGCHDNGPFIRSPYLAQLRGEATNRLPGTKQDANGRWDQRFSWNKTLPYAFVGNAFQSWKVYSVSMTGTGGGCMECHRLALSSRRVNAEPIVFFDGLGGNELQGTAQLYSRIATAATQEQKNPHSDDAPIWMKPGQTVWDPVTENQAIAVSSCATAIAVRGNNSNAPPLPVGCQSVQYGQGTSCRGGPIRAVLNGATKSSPDPGRVDTVVDLGTCKTGKCPIGYCYWRSVHGPFWQNSKWIFPIGDAAYRGSFIRIYDEGGGWKARAFSDSTGGVANAPPGGTVECSGFNEILAVPDANNCGSGLTSIADPSGTDLSDTADTKGIAAINILSGLIGNIAQAPRDFLKVFDQGGKVLLAQQHSKPPSPFKLGSMQGESWAHGCGGWSPKFAVKEVFTTSDVSLVAYPQSRDVRCFITGVTGAWSSTRDGGKTQPFAEIYSGAAKDFRLRVFPGGDGADNVGAYASCVSLK